MSSDGGGVNSYPDVETSLDATFASIRAVLAEHDGGVGGARARVADLVRAAVAAHGPDAATTIAIFLATAAATGFDNLAHRTGEPVEYLLGSFERDLRADTRFDLVVAGQFPPPLHDDV